MVETDVSLVVKVEPDESRVVRLARRFWLAEA